MRVARGDSSPPSSNRRSSEVSTFRGQRATNQSTIVCPLDWKNVARMTIASSDTSWRPTSVPPSLPTTTSVGTRCNHSSIALSSCSALTTRSANEPGRIVSSRSRIRSATTSAWLARSRSTTYAMVTTAASVPIAVATSEPTLPIQRCNRRWIGKVTSARQTAANVRPIASCTRATNTAVATAITPTIRSIASGASRTVPVFRSSSIVATCELPTQPGYPRRLSPKRCADAASVTRGTFAVVRTTE